MNLVEIIFNYFVMKKELNFKFSKYNYKLIFTSIGIIVLSVIFDLSINNILLKYASEVLLFLIWAALSVRRRDINMLLYIVTKGKKGKLKNEN
ncbi:hypothetical protein [Clostridium pasteurianum]|uniref:Uncharacterized protein n=1 Tax=Clostridium pasteurianum BC1 TaxID=86416 RepID=R4JYE7_CLOPA|nr:hypothetical protein [Clostridium pasteurianum]AGK95852.1 hypothetical protein Clopa_0828 [Clostridium pasteurianum BC1]